MKNYTYSANDISITVSTGNSKLGRVSNFNLPPILSCARRVPCARDCYALRYYRQYPSVNEAYNRNLNAINTDINTAFDLINKDIKQRDIIWYRLHAAGDFISQDYLNHWIFIAEDNPTVKFLAFTKQYYLDYSNIPDNFTVVFSAWPGYDMPVLPDNIAGIAYMQDGTEDRVPDNTLECPGDCESCGMCWQLHKVDGNAVVFYKH